MLWRSINVRSCEPSRLEGIRRQPSNTKWRTHSRTILSSYFWSSRNYFRKLQTDDLSLVLFAKTSLWCFACITILHIRISPLLLGMPWIIAKDWNYFFQLLYPGSCVVKLLSLDASSFATVQCCLYLIPFWASLTRFTHESLWLN